MFEFEDSFMNDMLQFEGAVYKLMADASENIRKKREEEYKHIRANYKYTFVDFGYDENFKNKFNIHPASHFYMLNTPNGIFKNYLFGNMLNLRDLEKKLNTQRFVQLTPYFEERYSDEIMVSCHGKNWKVAATDTGKPASPWHLSRYDIIFDTETCEIIFESDKKPFDHTYIWFFDNVAKIKQEKKDTIYFDMPNRHIIYASKGEEMLETADNLIVGKKDNYGKEQYPAIIINKHTCKTTKID